MCTSPVVHVSTSDTCVHQCGSEIAVACIISDTRVHARVLKGILAGTDTVTVL